MTTNLLIFDLDGTLVDTEKDLATAVNLMRRHFGLPPLPLSTITSYVGNGLRALVTRALEGTTVDIDDAVRIQGPLYREHMVDESCLYPGVREGLRRLHSQGHALAVATNKPIEATRRILDHFGITPLFARVLGGGSTPNLKPHPEMIDLIMTATGYQAAATWVVGDNYTDLESARRAGARSIFVTYGYGQPGAETPTLRLDTFDAVVQHFRTATPARTRP